MAELAGDGAVRLRSFISRLENLNTEIDDLNADKSEVYKEAKGDGYDVSAVKAVISDRRKRTKNPQRYAELEQIIITYQRVLEAGMAFAHAHARRDEVERADA